MLGLEGLGLRSLWSLGYSSCRILHVVLGFRAYRVSSGLSTLASGWRSCLSENKRLIEPEVDLA